MYKPIERQVVILQKSEFSWKQSASISKKKRIWILSNSPTMTSHFLQTYHFHVGLLDHLRLERCTTVSKVQGIIMLVLPDASLSHFV